MRLISFLIFWLCGLSIGFASEGLNYVEAKAKNGDGIYKLLHRYRLTEQCNVAQFLKLNGLQKNSHILKDVKYKLPLYQYTYNDKSIRSTIGKNDLPLAKKIAKYNRVLRDAGIKPKYYTQSKVLWVPHHLIHCSTSGDKATPTKIKPETGRSKTKKIPLFGDTYSDVHIKDNSLKNKVYYLISGHGGPDPGAMYQYKNTQLCEDEYAYDVTLRLAKNLIERGAQVEIIIQDKNDGIRDEAYLKIDHDEICLNKGHIPLNQLQRLKQRVSSVNDLYKQYKKKGFKDQRVIVIHVDSRPASQRQDVFFLHAKDSKKGPEIAKNLHKVFASKYKQHRKNKNYDGHVQARNLYVLRNTIPPAVYVELANIKNFRDRKRITDKDNRQALADWLFEGIIL